MEGELKQRIKERDLDAVLVIRPKAARRETKEIVAGGFYMPQGTSRFGLTGT